MVHHHAQVRYKVPGAQVAWILRSFWHRFQRGRIGADVEHFNLLSVGTHMLEFVTPHPPSMGSRVLVNVFMPGESYPYVLRGVVAAVKRGKHHQVYDVVVRFRKCPPTLADRIRDAGQAIM